MTKVLCLDDVGIIKLSKVNTVLCMCTATLSLFEESFFEESFFEESFFEESFFEESFFEVSFFEESLFEESFFDESLFEEAGIYFCLLIVHECS